jgi:hypothetical protein
MKVKYIISYFMYEHLKKRAAMRDTDIEMRNVEFLVHKAFPVTVPCRGCKGFGHPPAYPDRTCLMCGGDKTLVLHGVKMEGDLFTPLLTRREDMESALEEASEGATAN